MIHSLSCLLLWRKNCTTFKLPLRQAAWSPEVPLPRVRTKKKLEANHAGTPKGRQNVASGRGFVAKRLNKSECEHWHCQSLGLRGLCKLKVEVWDKCCNVVWHRNLQQFFIYAYGRKQTDQTAQNCPNKSKWNPNKTNYAAIIMTYMLSICQLKSRCQGAVGGWNIGTQLQEPTNRAQMPSPAEEKQLSVHLWEPWWHQRIGWTSMVQTCNDIKWQLFGSLPTLQSHFHWRTSFRPVKVSVKTAPAGSMTASRGKRGELFYSCKQIQAIPWK